MINSILSLSVPSESRLALWEDTPRSLERRASVCGLALLFSLAAPEWVENPTYFWWDTIYKWGALGQKGFKKCLSCSFKNHFLENAQKIFKKSFWSHFIFKNIFFGQDLKIQLRIPFSLKWTYVGIIFWENMPWFHISALIIWVFVIF